MHTRTYYRAVWWLKMDWAYVALLLLVVGCVSGGITLFIGFWNVIMGTYDVWSLGPALLVSGIVSVVTLLSSSIIINKKLWSHASQVPGIWTPLTFPLFWQLYDSPEHLRERLNLKLHQVYKRNEVMSLRLVNEMRKPKPECVECLDAWRRTGKPPECYKTRSCPRGVSPVPAKEQLDLWKLTFKR